jgi:hypothetical protein
MDLSKITDLTKDDVLAVAGLASRRSTTERVLAAAGIFAGGLLVGAGVALLLAPKSGKGLREDIGHRLRRGNSHAELTPEPRAAQTTSPEATQS